MVELKVQDYNENKKLFLEAKSKLGGVLGTECLIEHVGSTAIPNMLGKNIIDVLVGADDKNQFKEYLGAIAGLGFEPSINSNTTDIYRFFASKKGETASGDVHIHLVVKNTDRFDDFIVLRDYLLANPQEAQDYSLFKQKLIGSGIVDRKEYKATKAKYVSELIFRAKEWGRQK